MLRTGILGLAALTMVAGQAIAAPTSAGADGANRNQIALAMGGLPTPALRVCATKPTDVRMQCALGQNSQLADENDDDDHDRAGGYVVGALAFTAATLGLLAALDDDDDPVDVAPTPISS